MYVQRLRACFETHPQADFVRVKPSYGQIGISASGQLCRPCIMKLATLEELRKAQIQSAQMRQRGLLRASFRGRQFPRSQRD